MWTVQWVNGNLAVTASVFCHRKTTGDIVLVTIHIINLICGAIYVSASLCMYLHPHITLTLIIL